MFTYFRQQQTIARPVRLQGFGFWSGKDVTLELRPAAPDTGIIFVRHDLQPAVRIAALWTNCVEATRRTVLECGEARVEMVEHVLAALAGMQVDNCEIYVDAAEMPGLDGSSAPLVRALLRAGLVVQPAARPCLAVPHTVRVEEGSSWIEARPSVGYHVGYELDYGDGNPVGRQSLQLPIDPSTFCRQLAGARTFILKSEAEQLRAAGLAMRTTHRDVLVFDDHGVIDNQLRYSDECVRHKILDVLGDLALAGADLAGTVVACRSGHRLNARLVAQLWHEVESLAQPQRCAG